MIDRKAGRKRSIGRYGRYSKQSVFFVLVIILFCYSSILFAQSVSNPVTPTWQKISIVANIVVGLAGVFIPAVIAWGIHSYNKQQRELEQNRLKQQREFEAKQQLELFEQEKKRRESEYTLRQLQTAREFLPHFLSNETAVKWAAIDLIQVLGDEELANKIAKWLARGHLRDEDRGLMDRLMNDKDPHIAKLARQAFESNVPVAEAQPSKTLNSEYKLKASNIITARHSVVFKDDSAEHYGRWVATRGEHALILPKQFRMGIHLTTNQFFLDFIKAGGYTNDAYWSASPSSSRKNYLSQDGKTMGPSTWPSKDGCFPGKETHPVAGIGYYEALAFCNWLQDKFPPSEGRWKWCLPTEDMWEFAARTEAGFMYPWGQEFTADRCNSVEAGLRTTTDVNMYSKGASKDGCLDMSGNVWEFVVADHQESWSCVLKGGSFRNNKEELKTYLRLFGVPREHRPPDFGFRCAQVYNEVGCG